MFKDYWIHICECGHKIHFIPMLGMRPDACKNCNVKLPKELTLSV